MPSCGIARAPAACPRVYNLIVIQVNCPKCGTTLSFTDDFRGGAGRCHRCGATVSLPIELVMLPGQPPETAEASQIPERPSPDDSALTTIIKIASATRTITDLSDTRRPRSPWLAVALALSLIVSALLGAALVTIVMRGGAGPSPTPGALRTAIPGADTSFVREHAGGGESIESLRRQWRRIASAPLVLTQDTLQKLDDPLGHYEAQSQRYRINRNGVTWFPFEVRRSGPYEVIVRLSGGKVAGEQPRFSLILNHDVVIEQHLINGGVAAYRQRVHLDAGPLQVGISFNNDYYNKQTGEDRNLYLHGLELIPKTGGSEP